MNAVQELVRARMVVKNAKIVAFRSECRRLAALVRSGVVDRLSGVDTLHDIPIAHALVRAHGKDRIEAIIAEAFAGAEFNPLYAGEVAARSSQLCQW